MPDVPLVINSAFIVIDAISGPVFARPALFVYDATGAQQVTNTRAEGGQDAHILAGTVIQSLVCREAEGIIAAMKNLILAAMLLSTATLFFPMETAHASGDTAAGKIKAYTCTGCHGIPGYNNVYPTYKVPKIGGQNYEYLTVALKAYKAGERDHPTMDLQAQALSDQDIEDVAAYFASLGGE